MNMSNPWRGEVTLVIDGNAHVMRLTLGALAELETELGVSSLVALVERFEQNQFSSSDVLALLAAGLRGGGTGVEKAVLLEASIDGGPLEAARKAAELLARAFIIPDV